MKVYTKTGDKGKTSLFGGKRVNKNDIQIDAYGTVDEVNSWMGVLRDFAQSADEEKLLIHIQEILFTLGSYLATDANKKESMKLPVLREDFITQLENEMDAMDANLPEMKSFVLPGGHPAVSNCHVARTVCRRAERCIVALDTEDPDIYFTKRYVNRLSDYLFVLARKWTSDLKVKETPWNPSW